MKFVKLGLYLMILSVVSLVLTMHIGMGYMSGVIFSIGLFFTWGASIVWAYKKVFKRRP